MKMGRLTIIQRINIIKTYYKIDYFATATYRALRGDYASNWQNCGKILRNWSGYKY